ncbi:MAG: hypothetical protein A2W90_02370 [Bacteroidetes bacterium GWF2_42_66]|nr:MAG: hypothetical protein A2W92_08445 [Bacteroidetes bacterium GWA2_42_15]OFY01195.1 MAG: hypothetical protein A2W89_15855 [Bacteroidetes bacterium GWE2_42_39]OFY42038.1 MAG: hypothetical protein A2W90_02370 [Bacteroidetes bacterium GWF2_42_66]HBL77760.1 membrane-bound O-acyltransferase family protein [Prolixibacteraceae bacterium]HCB62889.1 membrane-bound O-acyltransferase family protein [Bacteroidales bacterium]
MVFNSATYFLFICLVFWVYWKLLREKTKTQNVFLLAASYLFYGWWDARFLLLIIFSSLIDFFLGSLLYKQTKRKNRRFILAFSLISNLGLLSFFKYYNFFIDSFVELSSIVGFQTNVKSLNIILPVGISFYTFQSLSYILDIYYRRIKPTRDIIAFMAFIAFFPQLVAGPIERAKNLLPQFQRIRIFDINQITGGLRLILYGLFKKMVIADRLAFFVDAAYQSPEQHPGFVLLTATFLFGFQIYCDFSGYSDIAIGSARLLGFELMQNFRTPFFAAGIREFWQRWHISLSTWFRDYIYIPLGGNRVTTQRWIFNILVTFTLSGIWHGAAFTYIIWGFIHGLLMVLEKQLGSIALFFRINKISKVIMTFVVVNLCFVLFRSDTFLNAMLIYSRIFDFDFTLNNWFSPNDFITNEYFISLIISFPVFIVFEWLTRKSDFNIFTARLTKWKRHSVYYLLLLLIVIFGVYKAAPQFIYFQF